MKIRLRLVGAIALIMAPVLFAQTTSTSTGGAGGAGGSAAGGIATGGAATNSNNTSGVSTASGGQGGSASGGSGGAANAVGGNVGTVSTGGSSASLGDVTVNWNTGSQPMGRDGLGVGVDPVTGAIMSDNNIKYSGSYKLKNTPDVGVGGPASGPCNGFSAGIGVSVAGFGIGGNTSTVDEGCAARETARIAAMLGRMDIANAVLENLPSVRAALRAKADREATAERPREFVPTSLSTNASAAPAVAMDPRIEANREAVRKALRDYEQAKREAELKAQQNQAQGALNRQATMNKLNDTLKFTDATNQHKDKTPQELMVEELEQEKKTAAVKLEQQRQAAIEQAKRTSADAEKAAAQAPSESQKAAAVQPEPEKARTEQAVAPASASPQVEVTPYREGTAAAAEPRPDVLDEQTAPVRQEPRRAPLEQLPPPPTTSAQAAPVSPEARGSLPTTVAALQPVSYALPTAGDMQRSSVASTVHKAEDAKKSAEISKAVVVDSILGIAREAAKPPLTNARTSAVEDRAKAAKAVLNFK